METKICTICHTEKPITEFRKRGKNSDKRRNECSECLRKKTKEYYAQNAEELKQWQKNHRIENKEVLSIYHKEKYLKNRDARLKYAKEYKFTNKELISEKAKEFRKINPDRVKSWDLMQSFGITFEHYSSMLEKQNGVCKICKQTESIGKNKNLSVDHCHTTGKIRGLLCHTCNTTLGKVKESIQTLQTMCDYITKEGDI